MSTVGTDSNKPAYLKHGRVFNNITLVMPHTGIMGASTQAVNGLVQPEDLNGIGSYQINASVISPALNVLCVNAARDEALSL